MPDRVERQPVAIMLRRVADTEIQRGWAELEELVDLRGRRFYGAFWAATGEYWVCVEERDGDDAAALGLERGTLAGGAYLRERLRGEPPELYEGIVPGFQRLLAQAEADPGRPTIEHYRRRDEIDLLLPV